MNKELANQIAIAAFKEEAKDLVKVYGIRKTVDTYGHTGPFAYVPESVDLTEFLEELFAGELS